MPVGVLLLAVGSAIAGGGTAWAMAGFWWALAAYARCGAATMLLVAATHHGMALARETRCGARFNEKTQGITAAPVLARRQL